jgi:hypothetical protein
MTAKAHLYCPPFEATKTQDMMYWHIIEQVLGKVALTNGNNT